MTDSGRIQKRAHDELEADMERVCSSVDPSLHIADFKRVKKENMMPFCKKVRLKFCCLIILQYFCTLLGFFQRNRGSSVP